MTTGNLDIQDNDTVVQYTSVGEAVFAFTFPILAAAELKVSIDQVELVYGAQFTIAGIGDAGGGTVTITAGTNAGESVTLWQDMPIERRTGFSAGAATLVPETLNDEFVARTRVEQQLRREIRNSLRLPPDDPVSGQDMVLQDNAARAGKFLAFDADGAPYPAEGTGADAALRTDLASTVASADGARLVGYRRTETGARARSVYSRFGDTISAADFAVAGNGIADDSAGLIKAIEAAWVPGGASSRKLLLPPGIYRTTMEIPWLSGVGLIGSGAKHTIIRPELSSGSAIDADITLIDQNASDFTLDGQNLTGTARLMRIIKGSRTHFRQVKFLNADGTTSPALQINGAGYLMKFNHCTWGGNHKHFEITRTVTSGDFPTAHLFDTCIMEESQSAAGAAMSIVDCSNIKLRDCVVQGNKSLYGLFLGTTAAQETNDFHIVEGGWWEENGNGQTGSIGIYLSGTAARRLAKGKITGVSFHQGALKNPEYMIAAEWTDGLIVRDNLEGFGAGAEFIHDFGNNINMQIDARHVASTINTAFKQPVFWASANFNGKAGIVVNSSFNLTPTRDGAGEYTLTFRDAPPAVGYIIQASSEDGAVDLYQIASPGPASSTASFKLFISNAAGVAVDGRTIQVLVMAQPK